MPICHDLAGKRFVDFRTAVDMMTAVKFPDWALQGPVTVTWLMRHMLQNGGTPMAFHNEFLAET
eukprot:12404943-Karenia_brevis.AAC.1